MTTGSIQKAANEFNKINQKDTVEAIRSASKVFNRINEAEIEQANQKLNVKTNDNKIISGNDLEKFMKQEEQRPIIEDNER